MIKIANSKEPYTYYIITSGGWVRAQDSLDDSGWGRWGVSTKMITFYMNISA